MITASNRAGPFTHAANSISRTMGWVLAALVPATSYGLWLFGWPAVWLWGVTLLSALATEAAMLALLGQPLRARLFDGSALLTGWLLALSLPPWAPWWIGAHGQLRGHRHGQAPVWRPRDRTPSTRPWWRAWCC
jgi:electron transport complex protein RnfD